MSILTYNGIPGECIELKNEEELYEAINILKRQVEKNIGVNSPFIGVLQDVLNVLKDKYKIIPYPDSAYGR